MAVLWLLAVGFSLMPLAALLLLAYPSALREHQDLAWGLVAGIVGFLGLGHATATFLEGNALLKYEASPLVSAATIAGGILVGLALAWLLLARGNRGPEVGLGALVWAGTAYLALHSFDDGLVLGQAYAGVAPTGFPVNAVDTLATLAHRFAEGAFVIVPALFAGWRTQRATPLLLAGLVTIPAAYVPMAVLGSGTVSLGMVALDQGISVFVAGVEAGFATLLLLLGILPRVIGSRGPRWALWAGLGFLAMTLIHLLVE